MSKKASRSLESTAYHEAAHAVAYFEFGKRIRDVTIVPSAGEYDGCCFGYGKIPPLDGSIEITPGIKQKVERSIINDFMGALAEKRFLGKPSRGWTKLTDTHNAVGLAEYLVGSPKELDAYLNWLYVRAEGMIYNREEPWKAIEAIAQELLKKKTLSGKEALGIWQDVYLK